MMFRYHSWFGLGGVPAHDNPKALALQQRLHWPMIGIALLALPAFYFDLHVEEPALKLIGETLNALIFAAFLGELLAMLVLTRFRKLYLLRNWLGVIIVISSGVAMINDQEAFIPLLRMLRLTVAGIILLRTLTLLRNTLSPQALPYIIGLGGVFMALAGAGFYWLEPTVHSYAEGLWLAFTSGATVGYGDFVPTTWPARVFAVLMVFLGYALMSVATASIAAFLIGEDERRLRQEMHHDMRMLREEVKQMRAELQRHEKRQNLHEGESTPADDQQRNRP